MFLWRMMVWFYLDVVSLLGKFKAVHILAKKIFYILRPVKDDLGLKVSNVCCIHVNAEKYIQDWQVDPLKHGVKIMKDTYFDMKSSSFWNIIPYEKR
jgi:hypothetical protein